MKLICGKYIILRYLESNAQVMYTCRQERTMFMTPIELLDTIRAVGGASVPSFITGDERGALLEELSRMTLTEQPAEVGAYNVRQSFSSVMSFIPSGKFEQTYLRVESCLRIWFDSLTPSPLREPLRFTDLVVQQYPPGTIGISPHHDGKSFVNIIAVLVLEGQGRFAFCNDREGNGARNISNEPGDLILMRGVGFDGSDFQPFHFVDSITSKRTTFAMRQRKPRETLV